MFNYLIATTDSLVRQWFSDNRRPKFNSQLRKITNSIQQFGFSERLIDWLEFNGIFSTIRLYHAFRSYSLVYVLENGSTLGVLYISYSVVDEL